MYIQLLDGKEANMRIQLKAETQNFDSLLKTKSVSTLGVKDYPGCGVQYVLVRLWL